MKRGKVVLGSVLIAIGIAASTAAILSVMQAQEEISECPPNAECWYIGGRLVLMYMLIFTVGFPAVGGWLLLSGIRMS